MLNQSKLLAGMLIAATFAAGAAAGSVASVAWGDDGRREERSTRERRSYADWLQEELQLTSAQRESIQVLLQRRQALMHDIWSEMRPRFDTLRSQIRVEIGALLDEEQQSRYQALITKSDSSRAARSERSRRGQHDNQ